jgi:cell division protein FtsB
MGSDKESKMVKIDSMTIPLKVSLNEFEVSEKNKEVGQVCIQKFTLKKELLAQEARVKAIKKEIEMKDSEIEKLTDDISTRSETRDTYVEEYIEYTGGGYYRSLIDTNTGELVKGSHRPATDSEIGEASKRKLNFTPNIMDSECQDEPESDSYPEDELDDEPENSDE